MSDFAVGKPIRHSERRSSGCASSTSRFYWLLVIIFASYFKTLFADDVGEFIPRLERQGNSEREHDDSIRRIMRPVESTERNENELAELSSNGPGRVVSASEMTGDSLVSNSRSTNRSPHTSRNININVLSNIPFVDIIRAYRGLPVDPASEPLERARNRPVFFVHGPWKSASRA